jgi:hypothetical protein
MWLQ